MRNWFLVFLLGCVVGVVVSLIALSEPELTGAASALDDEDDGSGAQIAPVRSLSTRAIPLRGPGGPFNLVVLDPDTDDAALADALELALFQHDWGPVAAAARVLKLREQQGDGEAGFDALLAAGSLVALDHEYRRRALLLELRSHDNEATRLLDGDLPPAETERRLTDLFLRPILQPADAVVRRDAALLLARLGGEEGRELLMRALREDPDPETSRIAAQALAQAGDPAATEQLIATLRDDLDPALRARVAEALGANQDLAAGGPVASAMAQVALADLDVGVRSHALATLARADLENSALGRSALIQIASDETEARLLRVAAVAAIRAHHAISRSTPRPLVDLLEGLLQATDPELRLEVIQALEEVGDADTLDRLRLALLSARSQPERAALRDAVQTLELRAVPR